MQEIPISNPPVVFGSCEPNKYEARHHRSLKLGAKLKYVNILIPRDIIKRFNRRKMS